MAIRRRPPDLLAEQADLPLGFLRVGPSDLRELHELLSSRSAKVTIEAGDVLVDSVDHLYDVKRRDLRHLVFTTRGPEIKVYLRRIGASVHYQSNSTDGSALAGAVADLLGRCSVRRPVGIFALFAYAAGAVAALTVLDVLVDVVSGPPTQWLPPALVVGAVGVCAALAYVIGRAAGSITMIDWPSRSHPWRAQRYRHLVPSLVGVASQREGVEPSVGVRPRSLIPDGWVVLPVGFVRLYLDDVEDVIRYVEEAGHSVEIRAGGAKVDVIGDLVDATDEELDDIIVANGVGSVVVQLGARGAYVAARSESADARLADGLHRLLRARHAALPVGKGTVALYLLWLLTAALVPAVAVGLVRALTWELLAFGAIVVLMVILGVAYYRLASFRGGAMILPFRRGQRHDRTHDRLLLVASIVISAAFSIGLTYWQIAASR